METDPGTLLVVIFEDVWSVMEVAAGILLVGRVYEKVIRPVIGEAMGWVFGKC